MDVLTIAGTVKGQVELPDSVFGVEGNPGLVWESVRSHQANQRQGTACTKTRTEVSGTGKKPYRQKHTGMARHGSRRSPIFRKGGIVFGPRPRDYRVELPRKIRRQALLQALSARRAEGAVRVVEDFEPAAPKTREVFGILRTLGLEGSVLLLVGTVSPVMKRASRNIAGLTVMPARQVNAYEVLNHGQVVFTESGLGSLLQMVGGS
ncbi:50S ribosomal protein L4 [candidate division WOR-3 bacterium]|nr:50S ribosomal protein L4 [candidate division WOR-3 bacterium]